MIAPQPLGLVVLVVEDEPLLTMMLEALLDELGCTVADIAMSLPDAISKASHVEFDVAILDVHLRGETIWPLADRLDAEGRKFIIVSGADGRGSLSCYSHAAFLPKPYDVDTLAQALRSLMKA